MDVAVVVKAMGGEPALGGPVRSTAELDQAVRRGLPKQALASLATRYAPDETGRRRFIHGIVPRATWERRNTLSPQAGERVERLARLWARAEDIWRTEAEARRFMTTPHAMLDGATPVDAAQTELGGRRVERVLDGLDYGLPV